MPNYECRNCMCHQKNPYQVMPQQQYMPQDVMPQQAMMQPNAQQYMPQDVMPQQAMMQPNMQQYMPNPCMPQCIPQETVIRNVSLAAAYVPFQKMCNIFCPIDGLKQGTVFPELLSPYSGSEKKMNPSGMMKEGMM